MRARKKLKGNLHDVYQAEDSDAEEDKQAGQRYDDVDNFQYELPEDFEDEEIDEELAFTEEDKLQMAHLMQNGVQREDSEAGEAGELTRDDFSDDDSEADRLYGKPTRIAAAAVSANHEEAPSGSDVEDIFAALSSSEESEDEESEGDLDEDEPEGLRSLQKAVQDTLGPSAEPKKRTRTQILDEAVPESQFNLNAGEELGELTLADMLADLGPQKGKLSKAHKQLSQLAKKAQAVEAPLPGPIRSRKERQAGYEETKRDVTKWTPIVRVNREAPTLVFNNNRNDVPKTSSTASLAAKFKPESKMEAEVAAMLKAAGAQNEQEVEDAEQALALQAITAEDLAKRRDELAKMRSLLFRHEEKSRHLAKIKSKDYHRRMKKSARLKAEKAGELDDTSFIRLQAEKAEYERAKERLTLKHRNTSQWARRALKRGVDVHDDGKKEAIAEQLRLGQELRRKADRIDTVAASDDEDGGTQSETSSSDSETEEGGRIGKKGLSRKAASKLHAAANDVLENGDMADEEASKGLFSLPFMRRAQEKRKQAAQEEARQLLAELDGGMTEQTPSLGRRNFGLRGGTQANDAGIDGELLDPDSGSDADEDAEAKLVRLRKAAGLPDPGSTLDSESTPATRWQQATGRKAKQKARGQNKDYTEERVWEGATATSGGPIDVSISLPGANREMPAGDGIQAFAADEDSSDSSESGQVMGVLARTSAGQKALHSRSQILQPIGSKAQNGKLHRKSPIKEPQVGIGGQPQQVTVQSTEGKTPSTPAFISSKAFEGEKQGYHFKTGKQGLGYYANEGPAVPVKPGKRRSSKTEPQKAFEEETVDAAIANIATADVPLPDTAGGLDAGKGNELAQRELIARAFAGDNVAAEFEAEKDAEAERELPKIDTPTVLPGWGSWASNQREPKWLIAAREKAERQRQSAKAGRKDAKLKAVSITERWDKKAAKYNSTSLPYPFTSKEAFEGSIRQPLGSDFNSQQSFREMTKPAIIKNSGVIIQPLKYSQGSAEEQRKVQKTKSSVRQAVAKVSGGMAQPQRKRHR